MSPLPIVLSIDEAQNLCVLWFDPPMLRRVKQLLRARGAVSRMRFPFQAAAHWELGSKRLLIDTGLSHFTGGYALEGGADSVELFTEIGKQLAADAGMELTVSREVERVTPRHERH